MTMTLEQVRDWHREMEMLLAKAGSLSTGADRHKAAADAIDAHLTQPAQSVDVEKVREVIAYLKKGHRFDAEMADKLTAALPESKP